MTRTEIEGESTMAVIAGGDTSAAVLRSTMLQLILAPHAYAKLKREIKQAVEKGQISSPITNEQSLKLPYTQVSFYSFRFLVICPISLQPPYHPHNSR